MGIIRISAIVSDNFVNVGKWHSEGFYSASELCPLLSWKFSLQSGWPNSEQSAISIADEILLTWKRGLFCKDSANIFYQPLSSLPQNGERWRRRKTHWHNSVRVSPGAHSLRLPAVPAHWTGGEVPGRVPPPPYPYPFVDSLRLQRQISRIASNLEVLSMTADIGQHSDYLQFFGFLIGCL